jgi:hypothetical protein
MKDAEINYSDIPPLDKSFLKRATTAWPPVKKQLTIRLDADSWLGSRLRGEAIKHASTVSCAS